VTNRRRFLGQAAACAAATLLPAALRADPYAPLSAARMGKPVRVRGRVVAAGRGVPRVAVSDGVAVVDTAADGSYELVTAVDRERIQISLPAGYRIPTNRTGTARLWQPVEPDSRGEALAKFEIEPLERPAEEHTLLLLADVQTEDPDEMRWYHEQTVPDVLETLRSLGGREAFGVACGDIMFDHLELYPEYERSVARMGLPFFQVVGNHDLDLEASVDEASARTFMRHFGPRYYSFDRGAVHYVVLDDVFWHGGGYLGYLEGDQLRWLEADLARVEAGRSVIVAMHIPARGSQYLRRGSTKPEIGVAVTNRERLYRLLEPYKAHVLVGHMHESEHGFEHGLHEHVSGAVCGAFWSGPICADGTPSGYSVYDLRGEQVSWRYKATGQPFSYQMRAYPRGADPAAPDEIVVNVWDWDPAWSVVWYEDGERRGALERRVARDPLSVELHEGPELPPRRKWVEPYPTGHLFYARASREARRITIEATDRFGRVHTAEAPTV